jgi:HNH endonuclease
VGIEHASTAPKRSTNSGTLRRRPPCRNFGGDARSQELAGRIVERSARISSLLREQLSDIAEFDRAEGWRGDGAVSMVAWVTGQCAVSTSTARQWVRSAVNLESLPCLAEGLASGALSLDLVEPLAEVASPSSDAALREASINWSVRQARELAAWQRAREEAAAEARAAARAGCADTDVTGADADADAHADAHADADVAVGGSAAREFEHRTLRFNDTRRSIWIAFTRDDYAVAKSSLVRRVEAEQREREEDGAAAPALDPIGYVSYDQRLYDELMALLQIGSGGDSEKGSGSGRPKGAAVRPRVVVHAPLELLVGCSEDAVAEIAGVGPVSAEVVRRLACDANVDLAVEDPEGTILNQGRARRDPTPVQRVEIDRRDKGCRFSGCSYSEFTNVHHIVHWVDGGLTNLDNLVTLCGRHHRAVHELGWTVAGDANAVLTFTGPHGRSMRSAPSPTWRPSSVVGSRRADRESGRNAPMRR